MLFNSYIFIFAFLPVTLLGFFLLGSLGWKRTASVWLSVASLFFYAWWNPAGENAPWSPKYLALIIGSIWGNYLLGVWISAARGRGAIKRARAFLVGGVSVNLAVLAWFKYAGFFAANANALLGTHWHPGVIALPLAISFFTFTQIAYLVDAWHGVTKEYNFRWYVLFVSFFPHLIAGPIVLYRSLMPQFARPETWRFNADHFARGLSLFVVGLAKKVVIADALSPVAGAVFGSAEPGAAVAWAGALAYTLQLYFDFSGYSDMAIGLGRMFNVAFPQNFDSPYKARDIIDFWRRWHITLSTFLRDHVYIPLGGNRKGPARRYTNLLVTMLLGGLWHGAGWTFVIWGGLHGIYLVINHAWLHLTLGAKWKNEAWAGGAGRGLTLAAVIVAWVFFRSASAHDALELLAGMAGLHGVGGLGSLPGSGLAMIAISGAMALFAPNTNEIFRLAEPVKATANVPPSRWKLTPLTAALVAGLFVFAVLHLSRMTEFLYFQF